MLLEYMPQAFPTNWLLPQFLLFNDICGAIDATDVTNQSFERDALGISGRNNKTLAQPALGFSASTSGGSHSRKRHDLDIWVVLSDIVIVLFNVVQ